MKFKWVLIIGIIEISILSSCYIFRMPPYLKKHFTFLYTPNEKELYSLIHTDGYYTTIEIRTHRIPKGFSGQKSEFITDTTYMNYLFFKDGIVLSNMWPSVGTWDTVNLPIFLTKMAQDTTNTLKLLGTWGTYIISEDTIRMQIIHPSGSLNDGWSGWEDHFKILNKKTIKLIYTKPIHYLSPSDKKIYTEQFYQERIKDEKPAIFIKSKAIPNSDCWMKKERWFWKSEKDYNEYMNKKKANK